MAGSARQQRADRMPGIAGRPALPPGLDPTVPSIARTWDFLLGGKDNYAADRDHAARLIKVVPDAAALARENRDFLARAVTWLAGMEGIGQFVDLGCGLPTAPPPVHQAARRVRPGARVAYVDNDAMVITHARALLGGDDGVTVLDVDIRDPLAVLARAELAGAADIRQPAGVVAGMVLPFLAAGEAQRACAQLIAALAPGSWLVASAWTGPAATAGELAAAYQAAPLHRHTTADIAAFLSGLELVPPGIVHAGDWSPGATVAAPTLDEPCVLAAAGRVTGR